MKFRVIFLIIFLFYCKTQLVAENIWFPDEIKYSPEISKFVNNFNTYDIYALKNIYITIIEFIEEMIIAHNENILRANRFDTHTVKRPAFINGNLTIIECSDLVTYHSKWDEILEEYVMLGPAGNIFDEHLQIISKSFLHNKFLEHWHSLTGELLGEYIDINNLWEELLDPEYLLSLGFILLKDD